jgi:thioesterase domain-containing protein
MEIVTVPGDHFTMFREPGVGEIAKAISAALGYSGARLLPPAAAS